MIKTLAVDDEYLALNLLEEFIKKVPELELVAKVKSPMQALEILQQDSIDLLFLDIQMPTLSGNNLLKVLPNPPLTIFTTAYTDYAVEAFELKAIDYLLKPFSFERFLQAVNRAKQQLQTKPMTPSSILPQTIKNYCSIKVDGKIVKLYFDDILYVEGLKEYVRFVCKEGKYITLESLKNLEDLLPKIDFLRVHKSYIVSKKHVQEIEGNTLRVNQQRIPISRTRREEVMKAIF